MDSYGLNHHVFIVFSIRKLTTFPYFPWPTQLESRVPSRQNLPAKTSGLLWVAGHRGWRGAPCVRRGTFFWGLGIIHFLGVGGKPWENHRKMMVYWDLMG